MDQGVRQESVMWSWLFNLFMDVLMKELMLGVVVEGVIMLETGRELRVPSLFMLQIRKKLEN